MRTSVRCITDVDDDIGGIFTRTTEYVTQPVKYVGRKRPSARPSRCVVRGLPTDITITRGSCACSASSAARAADCCASAAASGAGGVNSASAPAGLASNQKPPGPPPFTICISNSWSPAASAKARTSAAHASHVSFAEGVVKAGKFLPARKAELVHLLDQLAAPTAINFGEGEASKSPADILKSFFDDAAPIVDFGEHAGLKRKADASDPGDPVAVANAARTYVAEKKKSGIAVSFAEAVRHVEKGDA